MSLLRGRRVLAIHPSHDLYGSDRMLVEAVRAMRAEGAIVDVVIPGHGRLVEALEREGVGVHVVDFPVLRKALLSPASLAGFVVDAWPAIRRLRAHLRRLEPDLVYVNTITVPHWLAAARLARIPAICHVHELESELPSLAASALLSPLCLADRVVVNSQATRRFLARRLPIVAGRTLVVYNGFRFGPAPAPPSLAGSIKLLIVGRLSPRKGQDIALAAVSQLSRQGHDVTLEFVGDTFEGYEWYEAKLREQASSLEIADKVTFAGFQADPTVAYARADIVLVPSHLESFGNVAVEALAAARPVVAFSVGGLPEIIDHGVTGLLVPPGDSNALARAIEILLTDPGRTVQMGAAGATVVRKRFPDSGFASGVSTAIGSVLASQGTITAASGIASSPAISSERMKSAAKADIR